MRIEQPGRQTRRKTRVHSDPPHPRAATLVPSSGARPGAAVVDHPGHPGADRDTWPAPHRPVRPSAIAAAIALTPGLAERLLAEHADDGHGRCGRCLLGAQAGRQRWPCRLHEYATRAGNCGAARSGELRAVGARW